MSVFGLFIELNDSSVAGEFDEGPTWYSSTSGAESNVWQTCGAAGEFVTSCEVVGERSSNAQDASGFFDRQ